MVVKVAACIQKISIPFFFQAIKDHKFVDLLEEPGTADLSTYVDFGALSMAARRAKEDVTCFGPIDQGDLLRSLGIDARLDNLLKVR